MGHGQSSPTQFIAESVQEPSVEKLLQDALKPFELKDAQTYRQDLHRMVSDHKEKKDPKLILSKTVPQIEKIIQFLEKLEKFSTKEKRGDWYRRTYTKSQESHPDGVKAEKDQLKKDPRKCKEAADHSERLSRVLSELQNENDELKKQLSRAQALKRLPQDSNLKDQCDQLQRQLDESRARNSVLKKQVADFSERLAEEMNTKVSLDEGALENVNIKNRPLKIAEEYGFFKSDTWLTAKEKLDAARISDIKAFKILVETLMEAETEAYHQHQEVQNAIYCAISRQGEKAPTKIDIASVDLKKLDTLAMKKIPDGVKNGIGDFLRINADTADVSILVEKIQEKLKPQVNRCIMRNSRGIRGGRLSVEGLNLEEYVKECARLTWKMILQRPPMAFDNSGIGERWRGDKKQDVFFRSGDPNKEGNVVQFYVHPALLHGDTLMVKGTVFVSAVE